MICRYKIKFISDIEQKIRKLLVNIAVAPFVGVWIEIYEWKLYSSQNGVAPFVGVWIEIDYWNEKRIRWNVAPFVGVWIEIEKMQKVQKDTMSLPSWECGLK